MKKKLVLMTSALMTIGLLAGCNQHIHYWEKTTYTWANDNSTCTAERVCKGDASHKEVETVSTTYQIITAATCKEDGKGRYTADFTSEAFVDQTKDITLKAIGTNGVLQLIPGAMIILHVLQLECVKKIQIM